jgi:hypothetical protein
VQRDEELVVGSVLACGATRLVSIVRLTAEQLGPWASGSAVLLGVVAAPPSGPCCFLAAEPVPAGVASWNDWLLARPALLENVRSRLAAPAQDVIAGQAGAASPPPGRERT